VKIYCELSKVEEELPLLKKYLKLLSNLNAALPREGGVQKPPRAGSITKGQSHVVLGEIASH